jgi:hypothetical protein
MRRTLPLTSLLALAVASACSSDAEQTRGEFDERAAFDPAPPINDQQPPASSDQPPPPEPEIEAEGTSCQALCDVGPTCVIEECVESCENALEDYPQCFTAWRDVLRCFVGNYCGSGQIPTGDLIEVCSTQYEALLSCVNIARPRNPRVSPARQ